MASEFTTAAVVMISIAWLIVAIAPIVFLFLRPSGATSSADADLILTTLGMIWLGPMTIVLVGFASGWLKTMLAVYNALRSMK